VAAGVGGYLRAQDARRVRAVATAERAQRLALAADLHDFVAHEVSGMLFQAQAAALDAELDPGRTRLALERIERAGQRALSTLDQTVHMLRETDVRRLGLAEVRELARRYSAAGPAPVDVRVAAEAEMCSAEVAALAYRVVIEALTNVRRHAPTATAVTVDIDSADVGAQPALRITVTNDADPAATSAVRPTSLRPAGGLGLAGLAERIRARDGMFTAGPDGAGGWRVTAAVPARYAARTLGNAR
jgi:signal transduction histidine kinase